MYYLLIFLTKIIEMNENKNEIFEKEVNHPGIFSELIKK